MERLSPGRARHVRRAAPELFALPAAGLQLLDLPPPPAVSPVMIVRTPLPAIRLQHLSETLAGLDRICAKHRGVIKFALEDVAGTLGEGLDSLALARIAALIGFDVGCRSGPNAGEDLPCSLCNFTLPRMDKSTNALLGRNVAEAGVDA
jgi:hypothetical protein